jgi:hypothetical protein
MSKPISAVRQRLIDDMTADEIAGGMMVCCLPRRDRRGSAPADARDPCRSHQPSNALPANREAIGPQLGVNTPRAMGSMRSAWIVRI